MGSDDLFKKRKARKLKERKISFRRSFDRVLIVCEGEQTEPLYFEEFKHEYDLSSANVFVTDASNGSDPSNMLRNFIKNRKKKITHLTEFSAFSIKTSMVIMTQLYECFQKMTVNLLPLRQFRVLNTGFCCILNILQNHFIQHQQSFQI